MSKGDNADIQRMYDLTSVWLRDCIRQSNVVSVKHAEIKLKELDILLATEFKEA